MFNVIFPKEERRILEKAGYYFLEDVNYLAMQINEEDLPSLQMNEEDLITVFELIYDEASENFTLLTNEMAYYFNGEAEIFSDTTCGIIPHVNLDPQSKLRKDVEKKVFRFKQGTFEKVTSPIDCLLPFYGRYLDA